LSVILETVPAAVWFTYDPEALQVIRNRFAAELMDMPLDGRKSFGTPDMVIDTVAYKGGEEVGRQDRPLSRAMRGEQTDNEEFIYLLPSGGKRTLLTSARPVRDASQNIIGAVQISLDISERKRGEEQRKLLVRELNHRVKNTLAVVQAIASQTLRNAVSLTDAQAALSSRLISLAKAHDILTHENWSGADLRELLNSTIASQVALDRFLITGEPVRVTPSLALALALGVHELTTNAIKYGALSNDSGTVLISWATYRLDDRQRIKIEWIERGGPAVEPPRRKGFGTRMIERILDSELAGSVEFKFDRVGITCIFEADLPDEEPEAAMPANIA
jgi:two-component sensor histidine kinase